MTTTPKPECSDCGQPQPRDPNKPLPPPLLVVRAEDVPAGMTGWEYLAQLLKERTDDPGL